MVLCKICGKSLFAVSNTHLIKHGITIEKYQKRFGRRSIGIPFQVGQLPHDDPRYIKWRKSLLSRPAPWSTGFTKETHPSIAKISKTFRRKKIDNFAEWRERARALGMISDTKPALTRNRKLAFLIGLVMGDGHISKFPRTQALEIALGTDKPSLWKYTAKILEEVFQKVPYVCKRKNVECMLLRIYQKDIDHRLGIPIGNRGKSNIKLPQWIWQDKDFLIACLLGLFEAEGSLSIHLRTYTYNFAFSNTNQSLLNEVEKALIYLGFHPERRNKAVRLRKKHEVFAFEELIGFRKYPIL